MAVTSWNIILVRFHKIRLCACNLKDRIKLENTKEICKASIFACITVLPTFMQKT